MIGLLFRSWRLVATVLTAVTVWHLLPGPTRDVATSVAHRALNAAGLREQASGSATVTAIVDGDTLRVRLADGTEQRLRLLLSDAPELSATRASTGHKIDCGGAAALNQMRSLVAVGDRVVLKADPTQDSQDKFGRSLSYVSHNGVDLGKAMIRAGWAKVYVYDRPGLRVVAYQAAAVSARVHHRGVYALCGGDFHRAVS
jgi:micrococcal nuclease